MDMGKYLEKQCLEVPYRYSDPGVIIDSEYPCSEGFQFGQSWSSNSCQSEVIQQVSYELFPFPCSLKLLFLGLAYVVYLVVIVRIRSFFQ